VEGRPVFRGWLLFFFASNCVGLVSRALGIVRFLAAAHPSEASAVGFLTFAPLLVHCILLGAMLYGLYLFALGDPHTPTWWGAVLVASAVATVVLNVANAYRSTVLDQAPFSVAFWSARRLSGMSGLAVTLAWLAYWMSSERVRRTFGMNSFRRNTAEARVTQRGFPDVPACALRVPSNYTEP
jgi:hypothetical protein